MDQTAPKDLDCDERIEWQITLDIVRLLNGLPIGQATSILKTATGFLLDCHTVDLKNPRCISKFTEFQEFLRGSGQ